MWFKRKLTLKATLDLHEDLSLRTLNVERGVDVEQLLDNVKQVVALHVINRLATRDAQHLSLNLEDGLAIGELDVEAVASQGEHLFLEHQRLGLSGDEVGKDADLAGRGLKLDGHCGWCLLC